MDELYQNYPKNSAGGHTRNVTYYNTNKPAGTPGGPLPANLNAQQQKIFEMNNNHHAVGMVGGIASPNGGQGPSIAMAFHKGNGGK